MAQVKINRYASNQISLTGLFGKNSLDKEIIIPEMDKDAIYKKWESEKVSKFAEPVEVDITLLDQGAWETVKSFNIIRLKITAIKASSIAVYFDKLNLTSNAELYIYNADGTVITGPITDKENIGNNKMWGSNVFNGTSVILELKTPIPETSLNKLHIQKILYGVNPNTKLPYSIKDSTTGPGFGLSSSCNINVICIAGWEQERRAIAQVVHGNGGWCSASLIMNTCNTNIPYILTANHCVVDGNGNPINTNNSTFEFLWFSPTCTPTTNTSSTLLFNGASIQSRWEQSDFALLRLNQVIPQNSTLTFLGWSRSTAPPNSSVGIHHPLGDIMKISIENNPASIGSVRNFPNTAWRVVWDQGTVQGGSSGSPLFDMNDHRVIGQLFSNTQPTNPPCNQPTGGTNYGRFNVSWEGGGTPATRLRDWLDPDNTGVMTTNTTDISLLSTSSNPSLTITGNQSFCSGTSSYTLNNNGMPYTGNVAWVSSDPTIASISPSGNPATLTKNGNGQVTITATITQCGNQFTHNLIIDVGLPEAPEFIEIYGNGADDPLYLCPGGYRAEAFTTKSYPNFEWLLPSTWTSSVSGGNNPFVVGTLGFDIPIHVYSLPSTEYMRVRTINGCGYSTPVFLEVGTDCGGYRMSNYTISPNPAKGHIKIDGSKHNKIIREIQLVDKLGNIKLISKFSQDTKFVNLNISKLSPDIYYIKIYDGHKWESKILKID